MHRRNETTASAGAPPPRPLRQRGVGATGWGLWSVLLTMLLMRLSRGVDGAGAAAIAGGAAAAGYMVGDLVSGLVHWFCDRAFEEGTPLIGPLFIKPFREHHRDPFAMTQHGSLELLGNSALGALPILAFA